MPDRTRDAGSLGKAIAIGLAGLVLNCLAFGPWALRSAIQEMAADHPHFGDFTGFYVPACMAGSDAQYDQASVLRVQQNITGTVQPHLMPTRLPFYYALIRPLCAMSYVSAHRVWVLVMVLAALSAIALLSLAQGRVAIVASLASAPLFLSILGSQDVALLYLVLAAGLWLRKTGRPLSAGFVLSLLLIKFHLFLLLPVLFLVKREFRLLAGAVSGSLLLLGACFAVDGRDWPRRYASLVLNPVLGPGAESMPNLHGLALWFTSAGFTSATAVETVLTVPVVAAAMWVIVRARFPLAFGAALLGGLLISRHAYTADCAVVVPAVIAIWQNASAPARQIAFICLLPFAYWLAGILNYGWVPAILFTALLLALTRIRSGGHGAEDSSSVSRILGFPV
jgi:hypothetical protein